MTAISGPARPVARPGSRTVRDVLLRPAVAGELPRLSDLTESVYGTRRSPEVLRWLLFPPAAGPVVESTVAERQGRIVGHVASLHCRYRIHGRTVSGAHRMLWMVEKGSRGRAGVPLAGQSPDTDFEVVLGGTVATKAILVKRGFREVGEALESRLSTSPGGAAGAERESLRVVLRAFDPAGDASASAPPEGTLANLAAPGHLQWLAACPELDGFLFTLEGSGRTLGPVLLYVNRGSDPPTGRIVHLPWLASGAEHALAACLDRLRQEGCAEASVLTTEPSLLQAVKSLGGETCYRRPLWFRNPNGTVNPDRFHLTYLEGDLAYRRV